MKAPLKLKLDFVWWGEPRFATKAETIVTSMTTEPMRTLVPDPLPAPVASRAAAQQALDDYRAASMRASGGSKSAIADRKQKRARLEQILRGWAKYVELVARKTGGLPILVSSGFDLHQPKRPVPHPLPAPVLQVFRNGLSGQINGQATPVFGASAYEGQICPGPDTSEANWKLAFHCTGSMKLIFPGLTPGQVYWFRLRALGREGWSPWSNTPQLMAV